MPATHGCASNLTVTRQRSRYVEPPPSDKDIWSKKYSHYDYCQLFNPRTGERDGMETAFWRFKRLDWGVYIRTRAGRRRKHYKKTPAQLWHGEQHIFCAPFHGRRFDRMFHPDWKAARHLPEDPYDKYNKLSFFKHRWTKLKNSARIDRLGSNMYRFNRYKAFLSKSSTKYNRLPRENYEPPGYIENVHDNKGVYEPHSFVPENTPAPHFQRPPIKWYKFIKDRRWYSIKNLEPYGGYVDIWHPAHKAFDKKY